MRLLEQAEDLELDLERVEFRLRRGDYDREIGDAADREPVLELVGNLRRAAADLRVELAARNGAEP